MAKKKEENEVTVLFPEVEVDGVMVRPWSLGVLASISPAIEELFRKIEERKMEIDFSIASIMRLYFAAAQQLIPIMSKTLDLPPEVVSEFSIEKSAKILGIIWEQNKDSLKNVIALFGTIMVGEQANQVEERNQ